MATAKKAVTKKAPAKAKSVKVSLAIMGAPTQTKTVKSGTTLDQIIATHNLQSLKVTVNNAKQSVSYVLAANDIIIAHPNVKDGSTR